MLSQASSKPFVLETAAGISPPPLVVALGLMALSGAAGLGWQILWTEQLGVHLGHEFVAVLAVVAAFFGGLALGSWGFEKRLHGRFSAATIYVHCELVIAMWGATLAWALPMLAAGLGPLIGAQPPPAWHWIVAFAGPFLLLLPATVAMGATLPAAERMTGRLSSEGYAIGALYGTNTLGAMVGVLGVALWCVPRFGLAHTAWACAAVNAVCAAIAWCLFVKPRAGTSALSDPRADRADITAAGSPGAVLLLTTGLLGIGYEIVVVRVLSQVAQDTVFTFAIILAIYLGGTALGAALYDRLRGHAGALTSRRVQLLRAVALACVLGAASLWGAAAIMSAVENALGPGFAQAVSAEAATALFALGLPSLAMGALFSHLCVEARRAGWGFGRAIAANTLGAALAPVLFGLLLVPAIGSKLTLCLIALGYVACTAFGYSVRPRWQALWPAALPIAVALLAPPLVFVDVPPGGRIVSYRDGVMASVSVVADEDDVLRLRIDNREQEGDSASLYSDARQAWLPLLLHPSPARSLFLGLGTGTTARAAAEASPGTVDAVELVAEVVAASPAFLPALGPASARREPHMMVADARRFIRSPGERYDVVVSDLFRPSRSGAGSLYTREHFSAVRTRLTEGGLFCQWLPLHQLDLDTLRSIVGAFLSVYPDAYALLATNSLDTPIIALVGRPSGVVDDADLSTRVAAFGSAARREQLQIADAFAVVGSFIAGPRSLREFARGAPVNTDDLPVVAHSAAGLAYFADSTPRERLEAVLTKWHIEPSELPGADDRLGRYWQARRLFIATGMHVQPSLDPAQMLAQVQEPLLAAVRLSPDFRPAYDPLIRMAQEIASNDRARARALLVELAAANPARPEAALLIKTLDSVTP